MGSFLHHFVINFLSLWHHFGIISQDKIGGQPISSKKLKLSHRVWMAIMVCSAPQHLFCTRGGWMTMWPLGQVLHLHKPRCGSPVRDKRKQKSMYARVVK